MRHLSGLNRRYQASNLQEPGGILISNNVQGKPTVMIVMINHEDDGVMVTVEAKIKTMMLMKSII